ncbi:MAG: hypothetical protein H8E37_09015 [Planctomycetes bacterium]|nr:hypothetical protein [Planctomycetota bacterium]
MRTRYKLAVLTVVMGFLILGLALMPSLGHSPSEEVWTEFQSFDRFAAVELRGTDRAAAAALKDAVIQWEKSGIADRNPLANPSHCPLLKSGVDPWGTPFTYVASPACGLILLRSCGPNRDNNKGNGDDIQIIIALTGEAMRLTHPASYAK